MALDDDVDLNEEMLNASRFMLDRNAERVVASSRLMGHDGAEELMQRAADDALTPAEADRLRAMIPQLLPEVAEEASRLLALWEQRRAQAQPAG